MDEQKIQQIAQVAHDAMRSFASTLGDHTMKPWWSASQDNRNSTLENVRTHVAELKRGRSVDSAHAHDKWMAERRANGWIYGEKKDPVLKTHPSLIPYEKLPASEKAKDYLFSGVVESLYKAFASSQ